MIIDRRFFRIGAIGRNITSDVVLELSEEIVELIVRGRNTIYVYWRGSLELRITDLFF